MNGPELGFAAASNTAVLGWLLLLASLVAPLRWRALLRRVGGRIVPALLAAGYIAALLIGFADARVRGGFGSLSEVAALFSVPGLLLAGWIHYLAFDLLIGRWQIDDWTGGGGACAGRGISGPAAWWLWPCLALTFMFGPAGWLLYLLLRTLIPRIATHRSMLT